MLTKLKLALLLSAPLIAGAATYAAAQDSSPSHQAMIQKFDTNGDGVLDATERANMRAAFAAKRAARRQAMLDKYDTNKDGKLEPAERAVMRNDLLTQRFQKLDANGDGMISLDEFKAGAQMGHRHARFGHHHRRAGATGAPGAPTTTTAPTTAPGQRV